MDLGKEQHIMKIEIWSDFVCPFCYIGKRNFEDALNKSGFSDKVEIVYKSFELDPNAKRDGNLPARELLMKKYGMSSERAAQSIEDLTRSAKEVGLEYQLDQAIQTNTFDAHRLSHYAKEVGKSQIYMEHLFKAHFTEGLHIGDHKVLLMIGEVIGLDSEKVIKILGGDDYSDAVRSDERKAHELGIKGVPYFLIDGKHAIYGAQPSASFLKAFEESKRSNEPQINIL